MDALQQALKIAFATEYAFYLKAHYFHWNVEGADFINIINCLVKSTKKYTAALMTLQKTFVKQVLIPQAHSHDSVC